MACVDQLVQLNESIDEIRSLGYELYGVSGDTSDAQRNFIETRDFRFNLLSDPEFEFYVQAGISTNGTGSVNRGIMVYNPDGEVIFAETTEDPAAALINFLNL